MAHVLFEGDIEQQPVLRSLLWQWGVTVCPVAAAGCRSRATVEECDAVLRVVGNPHPADEDFSAMPDGAEAEGAAAAAAPLLVIGSPVPPGVLAGDDTVVIPDPGPSGCRLKVALQVCLEKARRLRGNPESSHDLNRFRDFVGHELRSPLTAVMTALTALGEGKISDPGAARMLNIARRNLKRLGDTVEWSQELASLTASVPAADLVPVSAASLAGIIPEHLEVRLGRNCDSGGILTDPGLLGILVRQVERVFTYACPGNPPAFELDFDPDNGDCRLSARVSPGSGDPAAHPVARSGNPEPGLDTACGKRAEFDNLSRMLISPQLLQVLGVRIRVSGGPRDSWELSCRLPLWNPAPLCGV